MAEDLAEAPENPKLVKITVECETKRCIFCKKSQLNEIEWGVMYQLDDIVVHYFCLLFCAALNQNGQDHEGILGFLPADIKKELRRGEKLKCKYCKTSGATLGCALAKCKCSFHFTCGIPMGTLHQFSDSFNSYCCVHKPKVTIPVPKDLWTCGICFGEVKDDENPVWPPCCKNIIFHRLCMQQYASSSGSYFFSCPHCKNNGTFVKAMKDSGVYVPERDAQWEMEPGAFEDLARIYTHCDAKHCFCKHGRDHEKASSRRWRMVRCGDCGSAAIHAFCGSLNEATTTWQCPGCSRIAFTGRSNERRSSLHRSLLGASSSDDLSDIDARRGNIGDDNYLIQVAARSSLVGVERETNLCHHPREYIQRTPIVVDLSSGRDEDTGKTLRLPPGLKALFESKLKALRINDEKNRQQTNLEKPECASADARNSYKEKLGKLKKQSDACKTTSEISCVAPQENEIGCLSVANLDLSEHRSKKSKKLVTLPDFLGSQRYEQLKSFKIPKFNQPGSPGTKNINSFIDVPKEPEIVDQNFKKPSVHKGGKNKIKMSQLQNINSDRLREDIRNFLEKRKKQATLTTIPEKSAEELQLGGRLKPIRNERESETHTTKSGAQRRLSSESSAEVRTVVEVDEDDDDDVEFIEIVKHNKGKPPSEVVESEEDLHDGPPSVEGSPVFVPSDDDVIILSDCEDNTSKNVPLKRGKNKEEAGIPAPKRIRIRDET